MDTQERSNEQILSDIEQCQETISKFIFLQKDELSTVIEKLVEAQEHIHTIKRNAGKDPTTDISDATDVLFINLLPLH